MPSKDEIVQIMKSSNLYHVEGESTYVRRSLTIIGWLNWIFAMIPKEADCFYIDSLGDRRGSHAAQ